jgi:ABC-type sugar transport system ATPase subunit/ribose/xylose/arabinose/galactoside ABC-type transport system permease subunit
LRGCRNDVRATMLDSNSSATALIQCQRISKGFSGVRVLEDVDFDIRGGEVHTLMGENGAGKSTLMKIVAGVHRPDSGAIRFNGHEVTIPSPQAAGRLGIALIHQEPLSFPDLSVAENIFLGHALPRGKFGQLDWTAMNAQARRHLGALGVNLDPKTKLRGLSIADQQMVELAAALSRDAKALLMDEPTAALTPGEVERLFSIVRSLRDKGVAIVFISHRLPEVFDVSDRITVLRDGKCIGTKNVRETTKDEIVRMMVGRELSALYERAESKIGAPLLEVQGLTRAGQFRDVSFAVRAGEIVGLAGLVGAGRTEVTEAIFGLRTLDSGTVKVDQKPVYIRSPKRAIEHGLAYVPEDRQQNGLLLPMTIAANTSMANLGLVSRLGWIVPKRERSLAESWKQKLSTRLRDVAQPARELSGGNQQKVVLSKWLATNPRVLIVDEPTRGIDVGAKAEVHHVLAELARQGHAILMVSSDLPEVLAMSDRVLVMREGRIAAELSRQQATQESVMAAATGTGANSRAEGREQRAEAGTGSDSALCPHPSALPGSSLLTVFREIGILVYVIIAFVIASLLEPRFRTLENLRTIILYIPLILIIAIGQLMVIVTRNIDLSVGSALGLAAIVAGGIFVTNHDFPVWTATGVAIGVGTLVGVLNGTLVALLRVPAIIATLGTMTALRGLIYIWSGGRQVDPDKLPISLIELSQHGPLSAPWIIWFAAIVAIIGALFLRFTATGRQIYAIGSNPPAAVLRGIPVRRVLLLVFAITGALSGFAGILFGSRFGTINPNSVGVQMELVVISGVVIGGAAVAGGSGTVLGTVLGCLLLGVVNVALVMLKVSEFWQMAFYGGAIILAATVDALLRRGGRA